MRVSLAALCATCGLTARFPPPPPRFRRRAPCPCPRYFCASMLVPRCCTLPPASRCLSFVLQGGSLLQRKPSWRVLVSAPRPLSTWLVLCGVIVRTKARVIFAQTWRFLTPVVFASPLVPHDLCSHVYAAFSHHPPAVPLQQRHRDDRPQVFPAPAAPPKPALVVRSSAPRLCFFARAA